MRKIGVDLNFNAYLTSSNAASAIALVIGNESYVLSKTEANQLAAKLVYNAGEPAKLPGAPEQPLIWDETSEFVRLYRHEFNEFGEFS